MSGKPHTLQRWNESELYKEDVCIPISPASYPSRVFIKRKINVNNVYESL
jgi:hypothetical protein